MVCRSKVGGAGGRLLTEPGVSRDQLMLGGRATGVERLPAEALNETERGRRLNGLQGVGTEHGEHRVPGPVHAEVADEVLADEVGGTAGGQQQGGGCPLYQSAAAVGLPRGDRVLCPLL